MATATVTANAAAIDASLANTFYISNGANLTINNPTNSVDGMRIVLVISNSGGSPITVTPQVSSPTIAFGTDLTAFSNVAAGLKSYVTLAYVSAVTKWHLIGEIKGF